MTEFLDRKGVEILWGKIKSRYGNSVDGILTGDKPLVTPVIASATWQLYKNDGTTPVGQPVKTTNITVENGYKVKFTGMWKWTETSGKKNPTATSGNWGTTLPANNTASSTYTSGLISTTTNITQNITAPQAGLVYENGKIHQASTTAVDTTSCTARASFGNKIFYGVATAGTITDALISGLTSEITTSKTKQVNASATSASQMYVYAYPTTWGDLKAISKDGVDAVLTAFTKTTVSHNNGSGAAAISYNVYYTGNGALNSSCTLKFE